MVRVISEETSILHLFFAGVFFSLARFELLTRQPEYQDVSTAHFEMCVFASSLMNANYSTVAMPSNSNIIFKCLIDELAEEAIEWC